jgi:hypothetical protein
VKTGGRRAQEPEQRRNKESPKAAILHEAVLDEVDYCVKRAGNKSLGSGALGVRKIWIPKHQSLPISWYL